MTDTDEVWRACCLLVSRLSHFGRTIAKVNVLGYTFLPELTKEIPLSSIPKHFGGEKSHFHQRTHHRVCLTLRPFCAGEYEGYNDAFLFDWSSGGPMELQAELQVEVQAAQAQLVEQQAEAELPPPPPAKTEIETEK